jgi:hypothetical protein
MLATQEVEIRRIIVQDQPEQKVHKIPYQPMAGCGGLYLSSQLWRGSISRRVTVQAAQV